MAKRIDSGSENPKKVTAAWSDFKEFVQARNAKNWKGRKRLLKAIFDNLAENPVEIQVGEEDNQNYTIVHWVQSLKIDEATDTVSMLFTDELLPFLIYLKDQPYTRTIYEIGQYKSTFSVRIKELLELERFKNQHSFDIPLDTLKWQLGVEKMYKRFHDFRRYVLDTAQKELSAKNSPVQFSYTTINKHGKIVKRNVKAIRFYPKYKNIQIVDALPSGAENREGTPEISAEVVPDIIVNKDTEGQNIKNQHPDIFKKLGEWGLAEAMIFKFIAEKKLKELREAISFVEGRKGVKNPAGLFIKAMENGWKSELAKEDQKQKAAVKKAADAKKQEEQKKNKLHILRMEFHNKEKAICDEILNSHDGMLETAYNMAVAAQREKEGGHVILKRFPKDPEALYESRIYRQYIIQQVREIFEEQFAILDEEYLPEIELLSST